jgi:hypothetical protein
VTDSADGNRRHGGHDEARQKRTRYPAAASRTAAAELDDLVVAVPARSITGSGGHNSSLTRPRIPR